jgi:hypothetical protein
MSIIRDIQSEFSLNLSNSLPRDLYLKKSSSQLIQRPPDPPFEFEPPSVPLKEVTEEKHLSVPTTSRPRDSRGWDTYTQEDPHEAAASDQDEEEWSDSSSSSHGPADG